MAVSDLIRRLACRVTLAGAFSLLLGMNVSAQVQGRVVIGGQERGDVLVSLVTQTGQILDQAFTRIGGDFLLNGVSVTTLRSDNPVYLVVDEPGYQTFRHQIHQSELRNGGLSFTIYLEPETEPVSEGSADPSAVDVRQLQAHIPPSAVESYEAAMESLGKGEVDQALEGLRFSVDLAPEYYDAWIGLARVYERLERIPDAASAYERAAEVNPGGVLAQINLGALHYEQGERKRAERDPAALDEYRQARERLMRSVQLDPTSAVARFYLGATLHRLGHDEESAEWLERAIAMGGGYAGPARSMLINVYTSQQRYDAALEQIDQRLRENPDEAERESLERVRKQIETVMNR